MPVVASPLEIEASPRPERATDGLYQTFGPFRLSHPRPARLRCIGALATHADAAAQMFRGDDTTTGLEATMMRIPGVRRLLRLLPTHARVANEPIDRGRGGRRRRAEWWETLVQDVRYSARTLRRDARLTVFAVLIVGLGIGASVTVFSVVDALLVRPLPFDDPQRLVFISNGNAHDLSARTTQVRHVWTLQRESRTLTDVAGYSEFDGAGDHTLESDVGDPERLSRLEVTQNFFPLLGVRAEVGRMFAPDEAVPGGPRVILLSHRLWERRFGSDRDIVGRSIALDGKPATVVGVVPASFDFGTIFAPGRRIDFYAPFDLSMQRNNQGNMLALVGRLRGAATAAMAQQEAIALVARESRDGRYNAFHPLVAPLREHVSGAFRPAMLLLVGAVGLVMLMVCANLSNLLLTRMVAREREIALRVALGAHRGRLVRQLLTESVVLSVAGAALGLLLAVLGTSQLAHSQSIRLPLLDQVHVDWSALWFTIAAAVGTGVVFGLAPALRASSVAVTEMLKESGRGTSSGVRHDWIRGALVVSEVALACTLLVGAGLLTRSFLRVMEQDLGFHPESAVAIRIDPSRRFDTPALRIAYLADALQRVRAMPGIQSAGLTDVLPMGFNRRWSVSTPGSSERDPVTVFTRVVSEGYLDAMGVKVRSGRDFAASDDETGRRVVIVNASLAQRLWPGQNPLGRLIEPGGQGGQVEVIGIVPGLRYQALEQESGDDMYLPMRQQPDYDAVYVIARGALSSAAIVSTVRAALRPMDARLPLTEVRTLQEIVDQSVSPRRVIMMLLSGFAAFALVLASLGIFAVVSYGVVQRRREIGIRLALGATSAHVQLGVLLRTLRLTSLGLASGLAASWAIARVMQSMLFGVTFTDPATFAAALGALVAVAALAAFVPARRATRIEPAEALRAE